MNALFVAAFVAVAAVANAGLIGLGGAPVDSAAVISGPSGQIVRSGVAVAHAPWAVAHSAPLALAHSAPLALAHSAPLALAHSAPLALIAPAGSGLEGQWIPDINEKLYDDGSFKPHIYGY